MPLNLSARAEEMTTAWLKHLAKQHYQAYLRELDGMDCGRALAEVMNPRLLEHKVAFNQLMDKLAVRDSTCPSTRL